MTDRESQLLDFSKYFLSADGNKRKDGAMKLGTEECKYRYVYLIKDEYLDWFTNSGTWSHDFSDAYKTDDAISAILIAKLNRDRPVRLGGRADTAVKQMIEITTDEWTALVQKHRDCDDGNKNLTFWDLRLRNRETTRPEHILALTAVVWKLEGWDKVEPCASVSI